MIINAQSLDLAFRGFKAIYSDAYTKTHADYDKIAMTVPSSTAEENYGWLGQFPQLSEWLTGERQVKELEAFGFAVRNRKFESTVGIQRENFEDDKLGVFSPMFAEMATTARQHPDSIVFDLLSRGATEKCYDGQNFFDAEHPIPDSAGTTQDANGRSVALHSNFDDGAGPGWYLLDTSRAVRPIIWQERGKYEFQQVTMPNDSHVFMTDQHLYGVRARVNAGFGLWQLAHCSKQAMTTESYAAARAKMMTLKGDKGRPLGVRPTVLVVPPELESSARTLLLSDQINGSSNIWRGSCDLIVTPYLSV